MLTLPERYGLHINVAAVRGSVVAAGSDNHAEGILQCQCKKQKLSTEVHKPSLARPEIFVSDLSCLIRRFVG
jgi:hypothetical protein